MEEKLGRSERDYVELKEKFDGAVNEKEEMKYSSAKAIEAIELEKRKLIQACTDKSNSEAAHFDQRFNDLIAHHTNERELFSIEVERLKKMSGEKENAAAESLRLQKQETEELKTESKITVSRLEREVEDLKSALRVAEKTKEVEFENFNRIKWELQNKLNNSEEKGQDNEHRFMEKEREWRRKWEEERDEMRKFYEKKIEGLQGRLIGMRQEACDVRKMILGAANEMYQGYKEEADGGGSF